MWNDDDSIIHVREYASRRCDLFRSKIKTMMLSQEHWDLVYLVRMYPNLHDNTANDSEAISSILFYLIFLSSM